MGAPKSSSNNNTCCTLPPRPPAELSRLPARPTPAMDLADIRNLVLKTRASVVERVFPGLHPATRVSAAVRLLPPPPHTESPFSAGRKERVEVGADMMNRCVESSSGEESFRPS